MTNIKSGKKIKNRKRNIENTERKWSEDVVNIMRNRVGTIIKSIRIINSIVDIGNAPMTNIVITGTRIIRGVAMTIRVIGGLGISGIDTQESIQTYTGMEDITANMDI
jgi:hypothetical protein